MNNQIYHIWVICTPKRLETWPKWIRDILGRIFNLNGKIDYLYSESSSSPVVPIGYKNLRKIGEMYAEQPPVLKGWKT